LNSLKSSDPLASTSAAVNDAYKSYSVKAGFDLDISLLHSAKSNESFGSYVSAKMNNFFSGSASSEAF